MSSTDEENQPHNTHLREKFVMQETSDEDYNMMTMQECPRCKEFEPDHAFTNCSYDIERGPDGKSIQVFECTRCKHKWELKYK